MRHLIANVCSYIINAWVISYILADWRGVWREGSRAARLNHWTCFPAIAAWVVDYVADPPPLWMAVFVLPFPVLWWYVHKKHHNHKDTKRLLETGSGLVQRFHNRLIVIPESTN